MRGIRRAGAVALLTGALIGAGAGVASATGSPLDMLGLGGLGGTVPGTGSAKDHNLPAQPGGNGAPGQAPKEGSAAGGTEGLSANPLGGGLASGPEGGPGGAPQGGGSPLGGLGLPL